MNALINITNDARGSLRNSNDKVSRASLNVMMLKQKIEKSIIRHNPIVITNSSPIMECRNTIYAEDYDVEEDSFYLNGENYELHINLKEMEVIHDDLCEEEFIFTHEDTETKIYFLD